MLKEVLVRLSVVAFVCCLSVTAHAMADQKVHVNVPAGDLTAGLELLARQSGAEFVYRADQLKGLRTPGVAGDLTPKEAVTQLLIGTPLELRTDPSGAMLIAPPRANTTSTDAQQPQGDNAAKEGKKDSSTGFRVAQATPGQSQGDTSVEKQDEQTTKKKSVQLEEVVVTGSRIPTAAGQQAVPVRSYTGEDIANSGQTTVADFLNNLPDVSISSNEATTTSGFAGQTTVRLHGLPIGTTLVLLNGRRLETSYFGYFDLNNIPVSAIERVEVLPVGASAIYGADALGGAVNIILRRDFRGFEANGTLSHTTGANDTGANFSWGKGGERGSVSLLGTYQKRGELLGSQRTPTSTIDFPANAPTFFYVGDDCSPGSVYSLNGQNLPGLSSPEAGIPAGISGTPTIQQFAATAGKVNNCNDYRYQFIVPQTEREGALFSAHYQVAESADFFSEVMVSHEHLKTPSGPLIDEFAVLGTTLGAANPYNPFGQAVGVSFAYPAISNDFDQSDTLIQPLIGVRGSIFSEWHYEAFAYLSRDNLKIHQALGADSNAVQAALDSSNPATALNPFTTGAPGTPQLLQSLLASAQLAQYQLTNRIADGQGVLRGPLLHLPAGALEIVLGSEYSSEKQDTVGLAAQPLDLHRDSYAVFTEARAPLLGDYASPQRGDRLALTLAGRYDHTSDFGGKATWQGGLFWRPTVTLSFSGSYGVSYKAPQLQQITGAQNSFSTNFGLIDPFRGNEPVPSILGVFGSNPNLKPETGDSRTVSVKYSSDALHGLEASLTYFSVDISNYIARPPAQTIVNNPNLYPGAVIRAPPTPQDQQQGFLGQIIQVNDLFFNFGDLHVAGFDADIAYEADTSLGRFRPSIAVANIYKWQSALVPGAPLISYVSVANNTPGFAPRWKGTAALAWKEGPLSANLSGRYIGRYLDFQRYVPNSNELGNSWIFDASVRYEIGQSLARDNTWLAGTYVAVTAVNLFNKEPPFSYGIIPYASNEYDIRGRIVSVQGGIKW